MKFFKDRRLKKEAAESPPLKKEEWPDHVVTLDEKNFHQFIKKYPLSVVDFWAAWCGPCKSMTPRLRRLSKIYSGKVAFGKLDVQKNKETAKHYHIQGIPRMIFFSYGKDILSITGVRSIGDLKETIDDLLKKN